MSPSAMPDIEETTPNPEEIKMTRSLNIIVCGGGIAALGAAIALARKGHQVAVVEAASQLQEVGAGMPIPPNSSRILKSWGLERAFLAKVVWPQSMQLRRYETGEVVGKSEMNPSFQGKYGFPYWLIHRADYQKILYDAALGAGVQVLLGTPIASIDENIPNVMLQSGQELKADLIVGADGILSATRKSIAKNNVENLESPLCSFRATFPANAINSDPTVSHLMTDINGNVWMGPDADVVGYPIRNGEMYNFVLTRPGKVAIGEWNEPADVEELKNQYTGWEPAVQQLLSHVTSCVKWQLASLPPLEKWVSESGRVVLLGDAAHAMLPHLGQGAAMSIEDGAALAECLDRISELVDLPTVLRAFQDFRKPRCETISKAAQSSAANLHLHDGPEQEQRDLKMTQEMEGIAEPADGKLTLDKLRDKKFQPWMFGYDTVKQANIFLDSHLTRKGMGEGFVSRAIAQGGFLTL